MAPEYQSISTKLQSLAGETLETAAPLEAVNIRRLGCQIPVKVLTLR